MTSDLKGNPTTEHTAIPWRAHAHAKGFWRIRGPEGPYLADVDTEADAQLILRAVNNHDALLAALERLAPVSCQAEAYASPLYDAGLRCDQQGRPVQTWCVACYARAAIAAAKGEGA